MTAPTTLTATLDPGLGVVVMHDGEDSEGSYTTYSMDDEFQPLNRSTLYNIGGSKFAWPNLLYASTIKLRLDYTENDETTTLVTELVLPEDVNPHLLSGEYQPPVNAATGVTEGAPGSFTPAGSAIPPTLDALIRPGALGQTTAWVAGNWVDLGDGSQAHWGGVTWTAGVAPGARSSKTKQDDAVKVEERKTQKVAAADPKDVKKQPVQEAGDVKAEARRSDEIEGKAKK